MECEKSDFAELYYLQRRIRKLHIDYERKEREQIILIIVSNWKKRKKERKKLNVNITKIFTYFFLNQTNHLIINIKFGGQHRKTKIAPIKFQNY